ncbi:Protein RFT1-like [Quillaja saponaria]|uniref:Protein RFT1-like n=1 Tax=Quillaja saponaria TaxID=32244 RepID=A0AAD7QFY9_QUISA|nr:Protein RFT1-like [Quillaja saponaria]
MTILLHHLVFALAILILRLVFTEAAADCDLDDNPCTYASPPPPPFHLFPPRMAEWSKAPDSSSGPRERAWVQIPLLTKLLALFFY